MWPSRIDAHFVGHRVAVVVVFGQHGVERGDRAVARRCRRARTGAAARRTRTAGSRAAPAARRPTGPSSRSAAREARDRIDQQQHALAFVAEAFGDRGRGIGGAHALQRRPVGGRDDDHRAREAGFARGSRRGTRAPRGRVRRPARSRSRRRVAWRASMPSSVDLPPPAIAKMPMRWPSPTVSSASIARTPVGSGWSTPWRCSGDGASACSGVWCRSGPPSAAASRSGLPKASITRPSSAGPHGICATSAIACTAAPTATPCSATVGREDHLGRRRSRSPRPAARCRRARCRLRRCGTAGRCARARPVARSTVPPACTTRPSSTTVRVACSVRSRRCVVSSDTFMRALPD